MLEYHQSRKPIDKQIWQSEKCDGDEVEEEGAHWRALVAKHFVDRCVQGIRRLTSCLIDERLAGGAASRRRSIRLICIALQALVVEELPLIAQLFVARSRWNI